MDNHDVMYGNRGGDEIPKPKRRKGIMQRLGLIRRGRDYDDKVTTSCEDVWRF